MPLSTGHTDFRAVDLSDVLTRLKSNPDDIAWPECRQIVARIAGPLAEGLAGDPFRSLLFLLAEDPKWEVRKDVADAMARIPDNDLAVLTQQLLSDQHTYVRRAAERSLKERRERIRKSQKRKRAVELVMSLYQELEDKHGKSAAMKARRLAETLYDTLIAATVHEMRSVLTALKEDNAQIVERDAADQLDRAFLRRKSLKMADRFIFMERLLQDMRNCAQPVSTERIEVGVGDLLTEARSIVSENLKARNINPRQVTLDVSAVSNALVKVSRVHIVNAIINVLQNAYDFLPTNADGPFGQISVTTASKGRHIHVAIRDFGQGIPADSLEEVRQCLPGRTSRRHTGTGFGLCNARRFLEAHGGRLMIDSREDEGATVTLVLPAA